MSCKYLDHKKIPLCRVFPHGHTPSPRLLEEYCRREEQRCCPFHAKASREQRACADSHEAPPIR